VLAVLKDGPQTVADLKGKTVSISSAGSLTDWLGQNLSRQQGWGTDGIKLAPLGTTFCPPAGLSLKNTPEWSAGTEVEVFVQGLNVNEKWAPYGTWVKVAEARVSSDGSSIDTTSGGIPILSSIALSRK